MSDGAYYELTGTGAQGGGVGFNGAGMFLSRKSQWHLRLTQHHMASMGPGCFYPGNAVVAACNGQFAIQLQWGRDVSIPEMCSVPPRGLRGRCASMGPGCFYPGNRAVSAESRRASS